MMRYSSPGPGCETSVIAGRDTPAMFFYIFILISSLTCLSGAVDLDQ